MFVWRLLVGGKLTVQLPRQLCGAAKLLEFVAFLTWALSGVHTEHDIGRCRTMSSGVAVIEHIDLTAVFMRSVNTA